MTVPYIALVNASAVYAPTGFNRRDILPLSLVIDHKDNRVPEATITFKNPGLRPSELEGRRIFVHQQGRLLFDGVIETVPIGLVDDALTIEARARPLDEEVLRGQMTVLGNSLKVAPFWDTLLVPQGREDDWSEILAARAAVVSHSRIQGEPSIASAVGGARTLLVKPLKGSVTYKPGEKLPRRYGAKLTAAWKQTVAETFRVRPRSESSGLGFARIRTFTPDGIVENWPKNGATIGDGFTVRNSKCDFKRGFRNGKEPAETIDVRVALSDTELDPFIREQGLGTMSFQAFDVEAEADIDYRFEAERTETAEFVFDVAAQSGFIDAALDDDIEEIALRSLTDGTSGRPWQPDTDYQVDDLVVDGSQTYRCRVDHRSGKTRSGAEWVLTGESSYVAARRLETFFRTARGRQVLDCALERAKSRAMFASRALEVSFEAAMPKPWLVDGDMSIILDAGPSPNVLPGGFIRGRLIAYTLSWENGRRSFSGTLGCCVGTPGPSNAPVLGTPTGRAPSARGRVDVVVQNDAEQQRAIIEGSITPPEEGQETGAFTGTEILETVITITTTPAAATAFEQTVNIPISGVLTFPYQAPIEV